MSRMESAQIQVFGKGFRATEDSEEFQRLVPKEPSVLATGLERKLQGFRSWPAVIEPLYGVVKREAAAQFSVLVGAEEILASAFAVTEDSFKRPSVVIVCARVEIVWDSPDLALTFGRCVGLASRLAAEYGEAFAADQARVAAQLRRGAFLPNRRVDLLRERLPTQLDWAKLVNSIKKWRGIDGVATPRLVGLGANVVVGTKHEAERSSVKNGIAGFYDVREEEIIPVGEALKPWAAVSEQPESEVTLPVAVSGERFTQEEYMRSAALSLQSMSVSLEGIYRLLWRSLGGPSDDEDKKRR